MNPERTSEKETPEEETFDETVSGLIAEERKKYRIIEVKTVDTTYYKVQKRVLDRFWWYDLEPGHVPFDVKWRMWWATNNGEKSPYPPANSASHAHDPDSHSRTILIFYSVEAANEYIKRLISLKYPDIYETQVIDE